MEKKIVMVEVCNHRELMSLKGCTITSVSGVDENEDAGGVLLECKDDNGNEVGLCISENGQWHFYDSRMKNITAEQLGELAMLVDCSDIDSVHFNRLKPLIEIVIKPLGTDAAYRVLTIIEKMFPNIEAKEGEWDFEDEHRPMYLCSEPDYNLIITVAVMPENH